MAIGSSPGGGPRRWCATRAHKNLCQLRQAHPGAFAGPPSTEGDLSLGPVPVLARLHRLSPAERRQLPAPLGEIVGELDLIRPAARPAAGVPLFSGTVWFVALELATSGGPSSVPATDLEVAMAFAESAAPVIRRYALAYGENSVAIGAGTIPYAMSVPDGRFTDQALRQWVGDIVAQQRIPATDALAFLNPPAGQNADAPVAQGVLGYHGAGERPYLFVNVLGSGLSVADPGDRFALALSHEIAEMVVDPGANASNPEVCDPCGPNCQTVIRDYFEPAGGYLGSDTAFPPPYPYGFFLNAIVQPAAATACPAPAAACAYAPP